MESNQTIPITKDYKVLVGCMTYNHSKYIVDALNGFAMQKTNFPFACIVIDDASTDGEPEVIKDWLQKECDMERAYFYDLDLANVIVVPHRTNANCTFAIYLLNRNLYNEENLKFNLVKDWGGHSEYLALCEGDDYWTDPKKLQIQSDCLDTHPEVDMCAHTFRQVSAISGNTHNIIQRRKINSIIPVEDIISGDGGFLSTNSIVYRTLIETNIPAFRRFMNYDYSLFIHGALKGGIYYIALEMSVYRENVPNSWCSNMKTNKKALENFIDRKKRMIELFDIEYNYKFHKIILQSCSSFGLKHLVSSQNTAKENIHYLCKYRKEFKHLHHNEKIKIIFKCIFPRFGKLCLNLLLGLFKYPAKQ